VNGEGAELGEGTIAEGTLVWFLAGVNTLVNLRERIVRKMLMMLQSF
jgi:hypothetical protein